MSWFPARKVFDGNSNVFQNIPPSAIAGGSQPPTVFAPTDYGFIAWNFDPAQADIGSTLAAGEAYLSLLPIRAAATITNVIAAVGLAGSGLTAGQCFAGLFDFNGNLLSPTADQSTNWQTAGLKVMPLAMPQAVTPGFYYVGWFFNGTTSPKFYQNPNANVAIGLSATAPGPHLGRSRAVVDTTNTGLTTAFHSPAALVGSINPYWAAVS